MYSVYECESCFLVKTLVVLKMMVWSSPQPKPSMLVEDVWFTLVCVSECKCFFVGASSTCEAKQEFKCR